MIATMLAATMPMPVQVVVDPLFARAERVSCNVFDHAGKKLTRLSGLAKFAPSETAGVFSISSSSSRFPSVKEQTAIGEFRSRQTLMITKANELFEYRFEESGKSSGRSTYVVVQFQYVAGKAGPRVSGIVGTGICDVAQQGPIE